MRKTHQRQESELNLGPRESLGPCFIYSGGHLPMDAGFDRSSIWTSTISFFALVGISRGDWWVLVTSFAAFSLTCFTCKDATSNIHCLSTTTCADHEKYCVTTYSTMGYGKCEAFLTLWLQEEVQYPWRGNIKTWWQWCLAILYCTNALDLQIPALGCTLKQQTSHKVWRWSPYVTYTQIMIRYAKAKEKSNSVKYRTIFIWKNIGEERLQERRRESLGTGLGSNSFYFEAVIP